MKLYRSMLLASVMVVSMSPFTVSANPNADELAAKIRVVRAAPPLVEKEEPKGWFSSFRSSVGNAFRSAGNYLRREENTNTPAGHLAHAAKEATAAAISAKTNVPVSSRVFNYIGNGLRTVGQWIKGGEETQTPTRVVLNNLGLFKSSSAEDIECALKTAATAIFRVSPKTAPEDFLDVVKGLNNRGHSTKTLDVYGIYVKALADELLAKKAMTFETFSNDMLAAALTEIEKVSGLKNVNSYLRDIYGKASAKQELDRFRKSAPAA